MAAISRSAEDIIIDNIVAILTAFSEEQVVEDVNVGFRVRRDMVRPPSASLVPLVNIWLDTLSPEESGSTRGVGAETATINLDCYAKGLDTTGDGIEDEAAMARLYYLKHQVKYALYRLVNSDFGLPAGAIAKKSWPRYQVFQNELRFPESEIVAGRWVIPITYDWIPEDIAGFTLEQIAVSTGLWSGKYDYTEEV